MKALLRRVKNVVNDRITRVLFYDQTLKKGYASLAPFSKLFILRRALVTAVAFPLSLVCWIFLLVLNLFTPVRIYRFERPNRPGFASVYIAQLEPLCRELQANGNKGFLVFIDASETTNLELLKLYASHFNLYLDDQSKFTRTVFSLIPKLGLINAYLELAKYSINWELPSAIDLNLSKKKFTPERILELGLDPFKFVLLTHSSLRYFKNYHGSSHSELNRLTDLTAAKETIRMIQEKGLKLVRMGVDTDDLPPSLKEFPVIDLSGEFRTETQDLWLSENCLLLWGINGNGAWHFAHKYDRPSLITNNYSLPRGYQPSFFTFQLIKDANGYLSLGRMAALKGVVGRKSEMRNRGLFFVENTPEQLSAAVAEVLESIDIGRILTESDEKLLSKFSEVLVGAGYPPMQLNHSQPCVSFLRDIQELLE